MNKHFLLSFFAVAIATVSYAGFTPGRYEIQDLGGKPIGTLAVAASETTFEGKSVLRIEWKFIYNTEPFKSQEKHEAFVAKDGLIFFRKNVVDDQGEIAIEGRLEGQTMAIRINDHGRKRSTGVSRKEFVVSEYDMEMGTSPFLGIKLKDAKSVPIFSVLELGAVTARRNVNAVQPFSFNGKFIAASVINTSFPHNVTTSWFTKDNHVLLKEMWRDRQFVRTGE